MSYQTEHLNLEEAMANMKKQSQLLRYEQVSARISRLKELRQWIKQHQTAIEQALIKDFNKPALETATSEVMFVLQEIQFAIKNLKEWATPKPVETPPHLLGTSSHIQYEPKGVCLIIAPWNYPFQLLLSPWISALAAGNCSILKPSELTPHTSALIADMVAALFEEEEALVVQGGPEVASKLLELPFDHIFFTGSQSVGKKVMAAAAETLSSVTLELGGKSPAIVDESADIELAAEKIVWAKFLNGGQTCIAPDYVLVHQRVYHELVDKLCEKIEQFYYPKSNYTQRAEHLAHIISKKHFNRLVSWLEEGVEEGGNVQIGGHHDQSDLYMSPTILSDLPDHVQLMKEEIFGPILPVRVVEGMTEAAAFVNSRPKPLALYMFSEDEWEIRMMLESTSSGGACVNDCILQYLNPELPFGGVSHSGMGKAHGYYGFLAFSNEKGVVTQEMGSKVTRFFYPPLVHRIKKSIDFTIKKLL